MGVQVRNAAAWQVVPTTSRLMYIRMGGVWKPVLDMWVKGNTAPALDPLVDTILVDYFDSLANWTQVSGSSVSLVAGRTGQGMQLDAATGMVYTIPVAKQAATIAVGFALKGTGNIGLTNIMYLKSDNGATEHLRVVVGVNGFISVTRAGVGGVQSAAGVIVGNGVWQYVEVLATLHDSAGAITVRVNGTVVASGTGLDTKNAGTKAVFDTVQLQGLAQVFGVYDDLYIASSLKGDIAALPAPPVQDHDWHKEATYSPQLVGPTNLRMSPADVNNHNTIPVAWDYSGLLPPDDFHVVVTNEGGGWLWEGAAGAGARAMTLGSFGQNARYRVYIAARKNGRPDTAWTGPLNWFLGKDSYVTNDVPVYGWGGEQEVMPSTYSQSSAANGDYGTWGFQKAQDGNFTSYWNTDLVDPTLNGNQGEGFRLWVPGNNYLLNGVRLWNLNYYTVWYGVNLNGNWQGGNTPYFGKYGFLVHGYNTGVNNIFNNDVRWGQYQTQGTGAYVDLLLQNPSYDGYNYRFGVVEARLLCQEWTQTGWGPRTVAAVNSGYW